MTPVTKAFNRVDRDIYTNPVSDPTLGMPVETKRLLEKALKDIGRPLKTNKPYILRHAMSMSLKKFFTTGLKPY